MRGSWSRGRVQGSVVRLDRRLGVFSQSSISHYTFTEVLANLTAEISSGEAKLSRHNSLGVGARNRQAMIRRHRRLPTVRVVTLNLHMQEMFDLCISRFDSWTGPCWQRTLRRYGAVVAA